MSKVLDLTVDEVIDYCATSECGAAVHFGQPVWKIGRDLFCSSGCLLKGLGATKVTAGEEVGQENECNV